MEIGGFYGGREFKSQRDERCGMPDTGNRIVGDGLEVLRKMGGIQDSRILLSF